MTGLSAGGLLGGRFELRSRLGTGGSGEVWLAHDRELDDRVALKILNPAFAGSPQQVRLLRDECRKARELQHPNIVRVYDFHEVDAHYFISMQYIAGGSLAQRTRIALPEILSFARMICDALEFAHRRGLVHRDLKPANVLVDPRGVAYLADFGIAAGLHDGEVLRGGGSLPYISPQQLAGDAPAIADDVYGFGSLLYELLAGHPLFHPGVTAARVREEVPAIPERDQAGDPLPAALRALLAAMLDKDAQRRPAGMGAVRSVLEDIAADLAPAPARELIQPRRRQRAGTVGELPRRPRRTDTRRPGLGGKWVLLAFAVLVVAVLGVIFLLPDVIERRGPVAVRPARVAEPEPEPAAPAAAESSPEARARADEQLGELLVLQDRLRGQAVERWGGGDWSESARLAADGDARYRARDYPAATTAYRRAVSLLKVLQTRVGEVLAEALGAGNAALLAGDRGTALEQYELALAVDPSSIAAARGLERAGRLDEVLALMSQATARESAGDLRAAAQAYRQVLELDSDWAPARQGAARTEGALARSAYETEMARGYDALAREDWDTGRRAFDAALRIRPGDADARSALAQLAAEERLQKIVALESRARELEAAEDWSGAVREYEKALALDGALESARLGLERSRSRAALAAQLDSAVANADGLNDESAWNRARELADKARGVKPMGPKLAAQIAALETALRVAATPVPVQFVSDNQTEVVLYKVGRLGFFDTLTVDLRPGNYVAVGSRDGFRDARRSFRVAPDGSTPPVVVRCEERI